MGAVSRTRRAVWRTTPEPDGQGEPGPEGDAAGRHDAAGLHDAAGWLASGLRPALLRAAAWAVVVIVVFLAAWREARQYGMQSDGASIALQAWQMLHGNLLLRGWHVADVSFYTTELPVYMLVEAVHGLRTDVAAISEAINYTLTVVCGALVAKGRVSGREGLVRALLAAGVMSAPSLAAANWLLNDADHAATALWVLFALLLIDRAGRRWYVPVLVGTLLAWATVGDELIAVIGAAPLVVVGLARAIQGTAASSTTGRMAWLRDRWFELSLAAAGAASVLVAMEVMRAIKDAGGWVLTTQAHQFVQAATLPSNLTVELQDFLGLFSANFFGQKVTGSIIPVLIHLAGAVVVAAGIAIAVRRFARGRDGRDGRERADLVTDLLVVAIACDLGAYLLLYSATPGQIREVSPVFALGAALAGRLLGGPLARRRLEPVLAAGIACYLLTMGPALTGQASPPANQALTVWLESHHLSNGLAGYWQSNSVTLDSGTRITMRPVKGGVGGRPVVYVWETDLSQLNPETNSADFLVLTSGHSAASPAISEAGAIKAFGKPVTIYRYQDYTIMVWDKNLLRFL